jgi:hypothetical protein
MFLETDVNAPRTVAEERTEDCTTEDFTNAWLDRVEASIERAHAVLLSSSARWNGLAANARI